MANESTKARARLHSEGLFNRFVYGNVLDVGAGGDPVVPTARAWDVGDGDAQYLTGLADESFDTVWSSHCLEHLRDPLVALLHWWRVLRPLGHLIVLVPDEDLYEQGHWPSLWNNDHKWTFNASKDFSWSPRHRSLAGLVRYLPRHRLISLRTIGTPRDPQAEPSDITASGEEAAVELIVQKQGPIPALKTSLDKMVLCPTCRRQQLTYLGQQGESHCLRCEACGETAIL